MARPAVPQSTVFRNTCTVAAILGFGVVTGALLAETSLMNFRLPRPSELLPRPAGLGAVNGYLPATTSPGLSRRAYSQPRQPMAHRTGI